MSRSTWSSLRSRSLSRPCLMSQPSTSQHLRTGVTHILTTVHFLLAPSRISILSRQSMIPGSVPRSPPQFTTAKLRPQSQRSISKPCIRILYRPHIQRSSLSHTSLPIARLMALGRHVYSQYHTAIDSELIENRSGEPIAENKEGDDAKELATGSQVMVRSGSNDDRIHM